MIDGRNQCGTLEKDVHSPRNNRGWIMRAALSVICSMTLLLVGGCVTPETDVAHHAVTLTPPYSDLPPAPTGIKIESGVKVALDAHLLSVVR